MTFKNNARYALATLLAATAAATLFSSCGGGSSVSAGSQTFALVCNPGFGGGSSGPTSSSSGVSATVFQLASDATVPPTATPVLDLEAAGTQLATTLYMNQLFIPEFDNFTGFTNMSGQVLRVPGGAVLASNFALHFSGALQLPNDGKHLSGQYQFAVLSDDGALFQLDTGSGLQQLVNNNIEETVEFGCAATGTTLNSGTSYNFTMDYFNLCQCSDDHTALVLLWRQVPSGGLPVMPTVPVSTTPTSPEQVCGIEGKNQFFTTPAGAPLPEGTALWNNAIDPNAGGWEVVPASAYQLTPGQSNPCSGNSG